MGAPAARITAADFLTPPELQNWSLAANPAGRIGGVRLELIGERGRTSVRECYQQVPLRVLPPFQFGPTEPALLYLLNPTAGLMDGDAQLVRLSVGAGCRAVVVGQSATRIHPCLHGFSTQQWHIDVGPGAVLAMLPGPTIPFQGSRYYQRVSINLAADAALAWGDIWLAGRYARGSASEQFQFAMLVQDLTVRRAGRLVFRDRACWRGPWDAEAAAWHFGGSMACGSLLVSASAGTLPAEAAPATFATAAGDRCYRWQGTSEGVTAQVVATALRACAVLAGGSADVPWLLASGNLAGNHWFTVHDPRAQIPTKLSGHPRITS